MTQPRKIKHEERARLALALLTAVARELGYRVAGRPYDDRPDMDDFLASIVENPTALVVKVPKVPAVKKKGKEKKIK